MKVSRKEVLKLDGNIFKFFWRFRWVGKKKLKTVVIWNLRKGISFDHAQWLIWKLDHDGWLAAKAGRRISWQEIVENYLNEK